MICPFCPLLCDSSQSLADCSLRKSALEQLKSRVDVVGLFVDELARSKSWIRESKSIMITGRVVSVESSRAVLEFAKRFNAVVDCSDREVSMDVATAISKTGTCSVSLAEARDLSDVFLVLGDDQFLQSFPELPAVLAKHDRTRNIILLGNHSHSSVVAWQKHHSNVWSFECDMERIPEALNSLFTYHNSGPLDHAPPQVASLAIFQALDHANYISLVWAPGTIDQSQIDFGGRSAWIERLLEHQVEWNEKRRIGSLAISGPDTVFQQVCLWTTGFPGRVSFETNGIEFDPAANSVKRWLSQNGNVPNALLIELDESAQSSNVWLDRESAGFVGRRIVASHSRRCESSGPDQTSHLPTKIAGFDRPADMLRGDQTVLARIPGEYTANQSDARSLPEWLEALSR